MSLYLLRNVKLVPLTGQDSIGRVSEVIPEAKSSRGQDQWLPPQPLEKLPFFSLGYGGG